MVSAIRQTVTIREDGRVEILSPELHSGAVAEIIVLVPNGSVASTSPSITALDHLQQRVQLDRGAAERWVQQVNEERNAV